MQLCIIASLVLHDVYGLCKRKSKLRKRTQARITDNDCADSDRELREGKQRSGRIFKHDVAITSDQSGIFHPAPFIRRKRERRGCAPPFLIPSSGFPPPLALVRIINGQFAASAADCIVSLFSGPPVARMADRLSSFLHPFPSFIRIQAVSALASRRAAIPLVLPSIDPFRPFFHPPPTTWPLHFKSGSKFVKTARAARGFGHLESLRLQNPSCTVSLRGHFLFPPLTVSTVRQKLKWGECN